MVVQRELLHPRIDAWVQFKLWQNLSRRQRPAFGHVENGLGQMQMTDVDIGHQRLDEPLLADVDEVFALGQRRANPRRHCRAVRRLNRFGVAGHLLGQQAAVAVVQDVARRVVGHEFARLALDIDGNDVEVAVFGVVPRPHLRHRALRQPQRREDDFLAHGIAAPRLIDGAAGNKPAHFGRLLAHTRADDKSGQFRDGLGFFGFEKVVVDLLEVSIGQRETRFPLLRGLNLSLIHRELLWQRPSRCGVVLNLVIIAVCAFTDNLKEMSAPSRAAERPAPP